MTIELAPYRGYSEDLAYYRQARDLYDGNVLSTEYIVPYDTEREGNQAAFGKVSDAAPTIQARIRRSFYDNLVQPIVDKHRAFLSQPITVEGLSEDDDLVVNIDMRGKHLQAFASRCYAAFLKFGRIGLIAEAPAVQPKTREEELLMGFRPFARMILPENIYRFSEHIDGANRGQLSELMFHTGIIQDPETDELTFVFWRYESLGAGYTVTKLGYKGKNSILLANDSPLTFEVLEEPSEVFPGNIPASIFGDGKPTSLIAPIVGPAIALLNRMSVRDHTLFKQCFERTIVSGVKEEDIERLKVLSVNTLTAITGQNVNVHNLEAVEPRSVMEVCDNLRDNILRQGDLRVLQMTVTNTRQVQSADSKAIDERTKEQVYNELLDLFSHEFTRLYRNMLSFRPRIAEADSVVVSIDRNFGLSNDETNLIALQQLRANAESYDDATKIVIYREVDLLVASAATRNSKFLSTVADALDSATLREEPLSSLSFSGIRQATIADATSGNA